MRRASSARAALAAVAAALAASGALALPSEVWDWHMPPETYRELEFSDRAGLDRAVKFFQQAIDAERRGEKVTDLVPRYRNAAGEFRKVQIRSEAGEPNPPLQAYAAFMQGYARMQAKDRNEAIRIFEEVVDLYPEERDVAVPARYMVSVARRQMGDVRAANEALDEIADDPSAEGHPVFYSVLRDRGVARRARGDLEGAADDFSRVVHSEGKVDGRLREWCRNDLVILKAVLLQFGDLERDALSQCGDTPKARRERLAWFASWFFDNRYDSSPLQFAVNCRYPRETKASAYKEAIEKSRRGFCSWFDGEASVFAGDGDGWTFAFAQLRLHSLVDKKDAVTARARSLEQLVKGAKGAVRDARARSLAWFLAEHRRDAAHAHAVADLADARLVRLRLHADIADQLGQYRERAQYLEEFVGSRPPPEADALKRAKYDLAWCYRHRLGDKEKALKVYRDIDDPPGSLWAVAETLRECGKKNEAYAGLTEIAAMFPNDAPRATLTTARWREDDGEKEKAIALYRRILSHPQWKQTGESSQAHQALERLGVATGGAMTNQVR